MNKIKLLVDPYKCYFCEVRSSGPNKKKFRNVVECHHIIEKNNGGSNDPCNLIPVCSNHHSLIHEGKIKLDKWFFSTKGWVMHWWDEKGVEKYGI